MQHLSQLLKIENSDLARVLRFGLHGLRSTLELALAEASLDPGAIACQELLSELNRLLETAPAPGDRGDNPVLSSQPEAAWEDVFEPLPQPSSSPVVQSISNLRLSRLQDAFISDNELRSYLGNFQFSSTTDADLWNEIQRSLLRVPATVAKSWRDRALKEAESVGAIEDLATRSLLQLPFSQNQLLYPGLTGTIQASGLCLSANAPLHPLLNNGILDGDLYFLACVVSICLKFIEDLDPSLHHALKSVYRFGVKSIDSDSERSKYIAALTDCFRRVQAGDPDPAVTLRARLDLDEAIHSLVYLPPVERDSWWGKLQQESRRTLERISDRVRQAGFKVQIRSLWGPYADVCALSKDDLELDSGGIAGEVLACLRLYAQIDREVFPGRLLFRSLQ